MDLDQEDFKFDEHEEEEEEEEEKISLSKVPLPKFKICQKNLHKEEMVPLTYR